MNDTASGLLEFEELAALKDVPSEVWRSLEPASFPFLDYDFHAALSSSCGERTGWHPRFLLGRQNGDVKGILPFFSKTNSYGEYIFDWDWAHAYHQHGMDYYPKWVVASPFTPATGPKCLAVSSDVKSALIAELVRRYQSSDAQSLHALFLTQGELEGYVNAGLAERHSIQFHWENRGYKDFHEFLGALKGKRRRQIVRERSQLAADINIQCYHDQEWEEGLDDLFYNFYRDTVTKKHAIPYLTPEFFRSVFCTMRDRIALFVARVAGEPVGASLSFLKGQGMYGRYWGCREEYRHLHFELCFYQTIEFAIRHGIKKLEAGAQGPHKITRGFDATTILSAHSLKDTRFDHAIRRYIEEEKAEVAGSIAHARSHSAFKDAT